MSNQDQSSYEVRYNDISGVLEYAEGLNWFTVPGIVGGITQLTGNVTAGPGAGSQVATLVGGTLSGSLNFSGTTNSFSPPVLTTTQKDALIATEGMTVYDITLHKLSVYTGSVWETVTSA
jgi:hypothetical protein